MHWTTDWKTKAAIQRVFARLPFGSERLYYQLQRRCGNLRHPESPFEMLRHGAEIFKELRELGTTVEGARVLEVGTGHRINMPLAFFLAGAKSITTVDLYRILKPALAMLAVKEIVAHRDRVAAMFMPLASTQTVVSRLERLASARSFGALIEAMRLDYRAPCDATASGLPDRSVDLHFSYTVLEHIPRQTVVSILREASRLRSPSGLICHHIDLSDHFSHSDSSISKINFLQFSAEEWKRIDNDRFGYQNRLRVSDYAAIYREAGQSVQRWIPVVDRESEDLLHNGFKLAPEYRDVDPDVLATVSVRAISV